VSLSVSETEMTAPPFDPQDRSSRSRPGKPHSPAAEEGVRVTRFRVGGDELVVVSEPTVRATDFPTLSEAERDVAFLATSGYSNKAIAARRGSHPQTIANQLTAIYRKLGVSSRAEMVARLLDSLAERRRGKRGP